jgi:hypothetical protein
LFPRGTMARHRSIGSFGTFRRKSGRKPKWSCAPAKHSYGTTDFGHGQSWYWSPGHWQDERDGAVPSRARRRRQYSCFYGRSTSTTPARDADEKPFRCRRRLANRLCRARALLCACGRDGRRCGSRRARTTLALEALSDATSPAFLRRPYSWPRAFGVGLAMGSKQPGRSFGAASCPPSLQLLWRMSDGLYARRQGKR